MLKYDQLYLLQMLSSFFEKTPGDAMQISISEPAYLNTLSNVAGHKYSLYPAITTNNFLLFLLLFFILYILKLFFNFDMCCLSAIDILYTSNDIAK